MIDKGVQQRNQEFTGPDSATYFAEENDFSAKNVKLKIN